MSQAPPVSRGPDLLPLWGAISLVMAGGTCGTLIRHIAHTMVGDAMGRPVATIIINITGAFLLGVLIETLAIRGTRMRRQREWRLALGTGLLGGYTTYSLISLDIAGILLDDQPNGALIYAVVTLAGGAVASVAGIIAARATGTKA